jgi:hypothetical protein
VGSYSVHIFKAKRGVTQGGPLLSTIFNLMVDAVGRARLITVTGLMNITNMRLLLLYFYTDNRLIMACNLSLLQQAFNSICGFFGRVGLKTKTKKIEAMVFLLGRISTCLSANAYKA